MTSECLFVKYVAHIVDEGAWEGKSIGYGTLLKKCTCEKCMEEKKSLEGLNKYGLREKER